MNTRYMETSIDSEMISQQTVCCEVGKSNNDCEFPEIAKKVPWTGNKDKEHSNGRITEIEQTGKDLNKARKVYFNLIKMQKMAQTKRTVQKRVVQEDKPSTPHQQAGKVPWVGRVKKTWKFRLVTKAL